ncbi:DUF922 domain-containing protein [Rubrivirga sp. IMCC45206]|uniref:DUF922 domain-containing protein n=1 Tax=Rubrivirga sp. IMCC45206 TaxID=3391614 RepID=UPI00399032FA
MRLLAFALALVTLGSASFWALTAGPLAPSAAHPVEALQPVAAGDTWSSNASAAGGPSPPAAPPPRTIRSRISARTYAVAGTTEREVLRSLLVRGPRDGDDIFFGLTQTELDVRYEPTPISGGCVIRDTEVDLDVVITLPEWLPATDLAPDLQSDWRRFRRALEAHENQHRAIAVDGAERAFDAVAELYRSSCEEANSEARRRLEVLGVEVKAEHRRLDEETGHGKADGAVWPVAKAEG